MSKPTPDLTQPGTSVKLTTTLEALRAQVGALKAAGHAVIMDEIYDAYGRLEHARAWHYYTCRACRKGASKNERP